MYKRGGKIVYTTEEELDKIYETHNNLRGYISEDMIDSLNVFAKNEITGNSENCDIVMAHSLPWSGLPIYIIDEESDDDDDEIIIPPVNKEIIKLPTIQDILDRNILSFSQKNSKLIG